MYSHMLVHHESFMVAPPELSLWGATVYCYHEVFDDMWVRRAATTAAAESLTGSWNHRRALCALTHTLERAHG